jgi:hypothetical protein
VCVALGVAVDFDGTQSLAQVVRTAEVDQLDRLVVEEHILRLKVTVHDAQGVKPLHLDTNQFEVVGRQFGREEAIGAAFEPHFISLVEKLG